jgi:hypothetical protein
MNLSKIVCESKRKYFYNDTQGRFSTVDLLIKLACFAYNVKKVLLMRSSSTKQVGTKRSTVLILPLQLVFHDDSNKQPSEQSHNAFKKKSDRVLKGRYNLVLVLVYAVASDSDQGTPTKWEGSVQWISLY